MTRLALPPRPRAPAPPAYSGPAIKVPQVAVFDFETEAIHRRPLYPPKPVSFSLQRPGERKPTFYAWGHPEGNNCDERKAKSIVTDLWRWALQEGNSVLMQNAKFDLDCAETHFGCPRLPWRNFHDTLFLLFLSDPHAKTHSLKPSAERILGMKPEEQDKVHQWLVAQRIVTSKQKDWGAYISRVPGQVVGPYANGDVVRTKKLFDKLYREIGERSMMVAYDRERRLLPILLRTEREGIRTDLKALEADLIMYQAALARVDIWLRKKLKAPNLNLDADKDVGDAFHREGIITEWTWTAGGQGRAPQRSVAKKNMPLTIFENQQVAAAYGYRGRLKTCLSMFMLPWLDMARTTGGTIHTEWSQVRQNRSENSQVGTRSGRLSSSPNFQNISKNFEEKTDGYFHPKFLKDLPKLPLMRRYLVPDNKASVWTKIDVNQQELRLLGHFERGELMYAYNVADARAAASGSKKDRLDVHTIVQRGIKEIMGLDFDRTRVKTFDFQNVYGAGKTAAAAALGVDLNTAGRVINVLMRVLPGYEKLLNWCKNQGALPIRTWGEREYHCEPPNYSKKYNRFMTFDYKRLNYLIQPSAADVTKEVTVRYDEAKKESRFLLSVHDEFDCSTPKKILRKEVGILRDVIMSIETEVKMVSDAEVGPNWGSLEAYD